MVTLRPYQESAIRELAARIAAGRRRIVVVAATGSGKTVVFAHVVANAVGDGQQVLVVAHRRELIQQTYEKLLRAGLDAAQVGVLMADDARRRPTAAVQVASIDTLRHRPKPSAGLVIVDECFPAGTVVDGRPIESLQVGDVVESFNHDTGRIERCRILRTLSSKPTSLVSVRLRDGSALDCTANHPLFTLRGYVAAATLQPTDIVVRRKSHGHPPEEVRDLRRGVLAPILEQQDDATLQPRMQAAPQGESVSSGSASLQAVRRAGDPERSRALAREDGGRLLQQDLREPASVGHELGGIGRLQSRARVATHERTQSDAPRGVEGEDAEGAPRQGASAGGAWRQRSRAFGTAAAARGSAGLADGGCNPDGRRAWIGVPDLLQGRRRAPERSDRDRDRRWQPCELEAAAGGRQEGGVLELVGVDGVQVHERGRACQFDRLCPGDRVFNLEVEGNANYFANGVLVHNCHRELARSYRDMRAHYPQAVHLGFTATPYRADNRGLGEFYDDLLAVASIGDLIAQGYLVEPRVFTVPAGYLPDLAGVRIRAGDYAQDQLDAAVDQAQLVGNIVEHWKQHAPGVRTVAFAVSVKHSKHIVERFREAGIAAEHLDGSTPAADRDAILARLVAGATLVCSNVGVLCEGTDLPPVKCAILARPTKSTGLYLQQAGRILRPWRGARAVILDHAGCAREHGLPQDEREFSLEPKPKRRRGEAIQLPIRVCDGCQAVLPARVRVCPECGFFFTEERPVPTEVEGQLVEAKAGEAAGALGDRPRGRRAKVEGDRALQRATFEQLRALARAQRRGEAWARERYIERYGAPPPQEWVESAWGSL